MISYADVEKIFEEYDDGYDRVRRLEALCHEDDAEVGRWLWEAFRQGHDELVEQSWYWSSMEEAEESAYTADELARFLALLGNDPAGLAELASGLRDLIGWDINLQQMLEQKLDEDPEAFVQAWSQVQYPMDVGFGYALARHGAVKRERLPAQTLEEVAASLVHTTCYEHDLEPATDVWGDEDVGQALAAAAGQPGPKIWSVAWMPLALVHATSQQRAYWVVNIDYARTVIEMVDFALEHFVDADFAALEDLLEDLVERDDINWWGNPPLQKLGFATAAIALARRASQNDTPLAEPGIRAFRRAVAHLDDEFLDPFCAGFEAVPTDRREQIVSEVLDHEDHYYNYSRFRLLSTVQTPDAIARAVEVVRGLPRGEPYELEYLRAAFASLGPQAAEPLLEAGWDKSPQREVIAVGLAATQNPIVVNRLIELLGDTIEGVREVAVDGLRAMVDDAKPALVEGLSERKKDVRLGCALALAGTSLDAAQRDVVSAALQKERVDEVVVALSALVGADAPVSSEDALEEGTLEWAAHAFTSSDPELASRAEEVLLESGEHGRGALVGALDAGRADVRLRAIDALMLNPDASLVEPFERTLQSDRSSRVKDRLAAALYELQSADRPAIGELEPTADNHAELDELLSENPPTPPKNVDLSQLDLCWSSGAAVSEPALARILNRLEQEGPGDADLQALRAHFDPESASATLESLRSQFDADSKEGRLGWVLDATALFADDDEMTAFGRGLDDEARYGSHSEAFRKLNVLRWHGAPAALQWIDHWARRAKSRGLNQRAQSALLDMADERGVTAEELSEQAMSHYGFDARGRQQVEWGTRGIITLSLGASNALLMHDESGKLWKRYPGALKDDDPDEIQAIKDRVSNLKKQVKQASKGQIERLEQALGSGREWEPGRWLDVYLSNPLIANLARHVLWCAFVDGEFAGAFRLGEDLSLADVHDEAFELPDGAVIRVAHPMYLGANQRKLWTELFVDYELIAPFEQVRREVFTPTDEERRFDEVRRFAGQYTEPARFRGHFERRGWHRGAAQDAGAVMWMTKPFHAADISAVIDVEPGFSVVGYGEWDDPQAAERIQFVAGATTDAGWSRDTVKIDDVEPVVFSEVLLDVESLLRR